MTFSGKKLQDIYDSGSQKLSELEDKSLTNLKSKAQTHQLDRQELEQQSKMEVAAKAAYVEEEIKKQARDAAQRLRQAADNESKITQDYLNQILERLTAFTTELENTIKVLNQTYDSNIDDNFMRASDHYSSVTEGLAVEVETQHYASGQHLRSQSAFYVNTLQQKLDHSLWECRGSEKQSNSLLFRNYMQKANTIESHFTNLMQKLSNEFHLEYSNLEAKASLEDDQLVNISENFSQTIEQILLEVESDINEVFAQTTNNLKQNLQSKCSGIGEQINDLGKDTAKDLKSQAQEIMARLTQTASSSNQDLKKRLDEVKDRVDTELANFNERLSGKVSESELVRKELEEAKSGIIAQIRSELIELKKDFEAKLNDLLKEANKSLEKTNQEINQELTDTYHRSLTKINQDANQAQAEIDAAVNNLMTIINQNKNNALQEITRAAGVSN